MLVNLWIQSSRLQIPHRCSFHCPNSDLMQKASALPLWYYWEIRESLHLTKLRELHESCTRNSAAYTRLDFDLLDHSTSDPSHLQWNSHSHSQRRQWDQHRRKDDYHSGWYLDYARPEISEIDWGNTKFIPPNPDCIFACRSRVLMNAAVSLEYVLGTSS